MCEVAASQLISSPHIPELLAICQYQFELTGNNLPILRKNLMLQHVLRHGNNVSIDLSNYSCFNNLLANRKELVVISLMNGILEAIVGTYGLTDKTSHFCGNLFALTTNIQTDMFNHFDEADFDEISYRSKERQERREDRNRKRKRFFLCHTNPI